MPSWKDTHFSVPNKPVTPQRRRRWWPWLIALPVLTITGLIAADRMALITLPGWWRSTAQSIPVVGPSLVPEHGALGQRGEDGAGKERQLRERVDSQERGINLMSRERAKVIDDVVVQQRLLDNATARLRVIEGTSTRGMAPLQLDNLRVAHADAVAAAKNATTRLKQLKDRQESLNRRIATAQAERDAALVELGITPPATDESGIAQ